MPSNYNKYGANSSNVAVRFYYPTTATVVGGENRGTKPVVLYMFYLSQQGLPLAVQHPEIPLE